MFYIFLIWDFIFFFLPAHEIHAFANKRRSFLFLKGRLLFGCCSSPRTLEIKAELLSAL